MAALIASLKTTLTGYLKYRGGEGHLSFLLHRLTGLGTLLFLSIHIVDTSFVYFAPQLYDHAIQLYRNPLFMLGEIGLVFAVIFHGVNGLRIAVVDMWLSDKWTIDAQRKAARTVLVVSVLLWLPAAVWMFRALLIHNTNLLGG